MQSDHQQSRLTTQTKIKRRSINLSSTANLTNKDKLSMTKSRDDLINSQQTVYKKEQNQKSGAFEIRIGNEESELASPEAIKSEFR